MNTTIDQKGPAVLRDLSLLAKNEVDPIQYVLTDVDDTITTKGKLRPEGLQALWDLSERGFKVICVTGGSAGWGDTYLRQWPVEAVLSESGAVCLYRKDGAIKRYVHPSIVQEGYADRMQKMIEQVLSQVPEAKLSSDQFARIFDVAFDHGSEPPYLDAERIAQVVEICKRAGAGTAVSSIHINAWFGSFDKRKGTSSFFRDILSIDEVTMRNICCYCGDAPNDQVMFSFFPLSFGVGNIKKHLSSMVDLPTYVAQGEGGEGFNEIAQALIATKVK